MLPEHEWEHEFAGEAAYERDFAAEGEAHPLPEFAAAGALEAEVGEQFLGRILRVVRRAAPLLKQIAPRLGSLVGGAVASPLGAQMANLAGSFLSDAAAELTAEAEAEGEVANEASFTAHEMQAEQMAAVAAQAQTEAEAEAMTGAATSLLLTAADQQALRRLLAHLVRGASVLTRLLRQRRQTWPLVRVVPEVVRRTRRQLMRLVATNPQLTPRAAGRIMAQQTARVFGNPRTVARAIYRNFRATRANVPPRRLPRHRTAAFEN